MRGIRCGVVLLGLLLAGSEATRAAIVHVNASHTGFEDGTLARPFNTIQEGLLAAVVGDEVHVAAGTYLESIAIPNGVDLIGAGAGVTIIDGTGQDNSVVTFGGTRFNPRLEGFTIRGGAGDQISELFGVPIFAGGGIQIVDSSPYISDCVIENNALTEGVVYGGGIYISTNLEYPQIVRNVIRNNTALSSTEAGEGFGGGIYVTSKQSSALIAENVIEGNVAAKGGGIYADLPGNAEINIIGNTIASNQAPDGAGVWSQVASFSELVVANNVIFDNSSSAGTLDCVEGNPNANPGLSEACADGVDNDCNPATPDLFDNDGDGWLCNVDCDQNNPEVNPGAAENCRDEIDNDCDGLIDRPVPFNRTAVRAGTPIRYRANITDPAIGLTWVASDFDDSAWDEGLYGIGFENISPGATALLATQVPSTTASVYTRARFQLATLAGINAIQVSADWDDGYVVWLNGIEVYRSPQMPAGEPTWNANPSSHESSNGQLPNYGALIDITALAEPLLVVGENVLAVAGYTNLPGSSSDLVLVPRLTFSIGEDDPDCLCPDVDGDGYACGDCDDTNADRSPGNDEFCNDGIDNDCNPATPDVFDLDGDGWNCTVDCDPTNPLVNPGRAEIGCDGIDNDCNPATPDIRDFDSDGFDCTVDCNDMNFAIAPNRVEFCFDGVDNNCDGFVDAADLECTCPNPVDLDGDGWRCRDCDDSAPLVNPGVLEQCGDGIDNDCNPTTPDTFDFDGDGYLCNVDCADTDPARHPGVPEKCNDGVDGDCDGFDDATDPDCACADGDGDGYRCNDCNDANAAVNPGHPEVCNDGLNNDCNAATPDVRDADGDGVTCVTDCDDNDPKIKPNAPESCTDMRDNDCDGFIDLLDPDVVLVELDSPMRWLANLSDPGIGLGWVAPGFDDTGWAPGAYGVGYELTAGGANTLIVTDVPAGAASVYTRSFFTIPEVDGVNQLTIGADWDDGWAAWINGVEVYRSPEMPAGGPVWNADPALHESSNGVTPIYAPIVDISTAGIPALTAGTNVLAVAVYNNITGSAGASSDLVVVPRLAMSYGSDDPDCLCPDLDDDGWRCDDCNDGNAGVNPGRPEIGCDGINNDCNTGTSDTLDADGDTYNCTTDCDDNDPAVHPGVPEIGCDGIDNDCNPATLDLRDGDSDGANCEVDCDDTNNQIRPGAPEIGCDGIDNDCSGLTADIRDGDQDGYTCDVDCLDSNAAAHPGRFEKCNDTIDNDCDGATDAADTDCACPDTDADGYACTDCNDASPNVHPDAPEVCNDGIDNDCNPATADVRDADNDGFDCLTDCDDANPFARPNAVEICDDGVDNDCNPATPDLFDADADSDLCNVDCADTDPGIGPSAAEICNDGVDNDCDPATSDLFDNDADGFNCAFDCNDSNNAVRPDATEVCNDGIDNDCNPSTLDLFDGDGDGAACNVDCADANPLRSPALAEKCNDGIDNDCDTLVDAADPQCSCGDPDGDGYSCTDCNNNNANVYPGRLEVCGNAVDDDCNAATPDVGDYDGDGYLCTVDCNEAAAAVNPGALEVCGDGVDNDCNAATPDVADVDGDGVNCGLDCDDNEALAFPGNPEIGCDLIDNDCDVMTSDLADSDGDNFGCADLSVRGGALAIQTFLTGTVRVVNNTIVANSLPKGVGGGIWIDEFSSTVPGIVANNVIVDNVALAGGGFEHTHFQGPIRNNLLFGNLGGDLYDAGGSPAISSGNLGLSPLFWSTAYGNLRFRPLSPGIDGADPAVAPLSDRDRYRRPFDGDGDMVALPDIGAYEYPSGEVFQVRFLSKTQLTWPVRPGETSYTVYRGLMSTLRNTGVYTQVPGTALGNAARFCNVAASSLPFSDPFVPSSTRTVFYLVTLTTSTFEGSLGQDSDGALRPNTYSCP